ncbi:MAG: hypothetical protein JXR83_12570 [Deltaproteobacteria bacterium]|nr:hypothetical protein [Deltaproteobacteria bacterium]
MAVSRDLLCPPLDRLIDSDARAVGPKALGLARLATSGLPLPPGFCVVADAYRAHLAALPGLDALLSRLATEEGDRRRTALSAIRLAIVERPLAADVGAAIDEAWGELSRRVDRPPLRTAVRSSGTAEDLPGQSFAGQHDTLLNVIDPGQCRRAIRRCWASLWNDRAYEYRSLNRIEHRQAAMAVIVQQLVEADVSAVVFTADPIAGRTDRVVIESTYGLGEALVSGKVSPDRVVLARPALTVVERVPGTKATEIVADEAGGVQERAVEAQRARGRSLDDAQAIALARLALQAEQAFGVPLDLEAAGIGGRIFLLQARPITALPLALADSPAALDTPPDRSDRQVWTNLNTGEVLPDVVTPASWNVLEPLARLLLGSVFVQLGISFGDSPLFGLIGGRVYFNLNTLLSMAVHIPGLRKDNLTSLFGGSQQAVTALGAIEIADEDLPPTRIAWLSVLWHLPRLLIDLLWRAPAQGQTLIDQARVGCDRWAALPLDRLADAELMTAVRQAMAEMLGQERAMVMAGFGITYQGLLFDRCRRWFGDVDGPALASRLLSGLRNNDLAAAGVDLWQLAQQTHARPEVARLVRTCASFEALREALATAEDGAVFLDGWQRFMSAHGHHCRGELELSNPRWQENPGEILGQLRSYLDAVGQRDFLDQYRRVADGRRTAEQSCRRRLRNPLRRWLFGFLLDRAQRCAGLRECLKNQIVRQLAGLRRLLLAIGQRLADRGTLAEIDDVFFLDLDEIAAALAATAPAGERALIATRRVEHQRNLSLRPPPVVVGRYDPVAATAGDPDAAPGELRGLAVNPGLVRGRARVILRAGEGQVLPGEILVAPFTDPGWTPYFVNAAAIVMDQGGLLSHGSIIAREFGIPAVVNVGPATSTIKTGQTIEVDGGSGVVRVVG